MLKALGRSRAIQAGLGVALAGYIRLIRRTTRWLTDPPNLYGEARHDLPLIAAMWHGQHLLIPIARPDWMPSSSLVSRHGDGEINAVALRRLGIGVVRGSGGSGTAKVLKRGGVPALRALLRTLAEGTSVVITADVPKVAGVAGLGIVTLAKLSGRPIYPVAAVTRRRIELGTWDRTTIGLPFGRGALVVGMPIRVARDADDTALEAARAAVGRELDRVHARAYELLGIRHSRWAHG